MTHQSMTHHHLSRLRSNATIRHVLSQTLIRPEKLMFPVFLVSGTKQKQTISSLPNQFRFSTDVLIETLPVLLKEGIKSLILFETIEESQKDNLGTHAGSNQSTVIQAIQAIKKHYPEMLVFTDVCMCAYTSHGHCGILNNNNQINLTATLERLSSIAVSHAQAGADGVAPSAMMDGQVRTIRTALDEHHLSSTLLMSYSTKFSSHLYSPFREAVHSAPSFGDRKSYQADYRTPSQAILESIADSHEGADILMVKPALFYLDIIQKIKEQTLLPLAAYNVSGEYAMINNLQPNDRQQTLSLAAESLHAINRAGAELIITYWANQYAELKHYL